MSSGTSLISKRDMYKSSRNFVKTLDIQLMKGKSHKVKQIKALELKDLE
jgi:hypothetical protein